MIKQKIITDFNKAANSYADYDFVQKLIAQKTIDKILEQKGKIVDLGSGTGNIARILRRDDIIEVDASAEMLKKSSSKNKINADIENLPIEDNSVDLVISSLVLHWTDHKKVLSEVARILKPSGRFVISTLGNQTFSELRESYLHFSLEPKIHKFFDAEFIPQEQELFTEFERKSEIIKINYPDFLSFARSIKNIGGSYKGKSEGGFKKIAKFYQDNFTNQEGVFASWEIIYFTGCL